MTGLGRWGGGNAALHSDRDDYINSGTGLVDDIERELDLVDDLERELDLARVAGGPADFAKS
jgi:hypothetical protein